jgi:hypothetical protein
MSRIGITVGLILCSISLFGQASDKPRIFIEEHTETNGIVRCVPGTCREYEVQSSVSLELTKELTKKCPTVAITGMKDAADYVLRLSSNGAVLYRQNGDLAYISSAHRISSLAKDICTFASGKAK